MHAMSPTSKMKCTVRALGWGWGRNGAEDDDCGPYALSTCIEDWLSSDRLPLLLHKYIHDFLSAELQRGFMIFLLKPAKLLLFIHHTA